MRHVLFFHFVLFTIVSCNSEEPCPSYPATYSYTFDVNDFDSKGVYEYNGDQLSKTEDNPDDLREFILPSDSIVEYLMDQALIQSFSITSLSTIDVEISFGDIDTTFSALYSLQEAPNYYTVYSEENSDFLIGGVEIAEDCSSVDVCSWLVFIIDINDIDKSRAIDYDGCFRFSEETFEEEPQILRSLGQNDIGKKILLIRFSQLYVLDN